jgi:UDP-N-acetylglucosamine 2-epimerase (non-hydrolysing)
LAGAVAAVKTTKLIHVESGLRSHDRRMPEEINRAIVDHLSDFLFTTEPAANANLLQEGIAEEKIKYVGNIMIESIEKYFDHIQTSDILSTLGLKEKSYIVSTIHRVENTDNPEILSKLLSVLHSLSKKQTIVFPVHPGTKKKIHEFGLDHLLDSVRVVEPLGYFEFMKLILESSGIVTDSGGIQEETSHLGIPCATLRDNTERPITLVLGSNKLFPIDSLNPEDIAELILHLERTDFKNRHIPLWNDKVSERIFAELDLI